MIREKIKKRMSEEGYNSIELAVRSSIPRPQTVSDFLNGKKGIKFEYLENIFKVLTIKLN